MRYDNEEWCKIWNRIDLPFQNWHEEFNKFWPAHSKISKICVLMGWFWLNYIMLQLKKHRRVMFDCTQDWYKVWRKTGLCFQKLTWGIWQIFTRALESFQIEIVMSSFCLKLKMYELKIYRGVLCHDNKEWCKKRNEKFDEFWPEHSKISKICTLGCFWLKYIMFELKKV